MYNDLINNINKLNAIEKTYRGWMKEEGFEYENEYIKVVSIDCSNKHTNNDMSKQWSIILRIKKDFSKLVSFKKLLDSKDVDIKLTPVKGLTSKNAGCYGIRVYNMKGNPTNEIVIQILDFIFQ